MITIFRLFCLFGFDLVFFFEIHRFLIKSGFQRTSPLSAAIGRQLIKGDVWNCVSGFGAPFRSGMFIGRSGRKKGGRDEKKDVTKGVLSLGYASTYRRQKR
jgi:hypothetical protein